MRALVTGALVVLVAACSDRGPQAPTASSGLPFVRDTPTIRVYHEPGDAVDADWQDVYNAWLLVRLGLPAQPLVEYRKYQSREAMGRYTGNVTTNGFAEPALWRFHTIWPRDNHEIVHIYTATVGRPSDFFNEGIAVACQTDPATGRLAAVFNGVDVHEASRGYLRQSQLPLPLADYVTTTSFRALPDQVLSYRYAGSFVRFLMDQHGVPAVLRFFGPGTRDESLATIRARLLATFGRTLEELEADWLALLRG